MNWMKQILSSMTVTATLMLAEVDPAMASTQANLSPAIDYVITEPMDLDLTSALTSAPPQKTDPKQQTVEHVRTVHVIAHEYQFTPNVIELRTGTKVELTLRNNGKESHNLTFKTLPFKTVTILSGESTELEMTVPAPGRYPFYCSVDDHVKKGMTGVLVVTK